MDKQLDIFNKNKIYSNRLQAYLLDYSDKGLRRHSSAEEEAIFKIVETGNLDALQNNFNSANIEDELYNRVGTMADNPTKSLEYMVVISIALASRAAVRGGLDLDTSYTLTDVFLHSLEKCKTINEILDIQVDALYIFTELVHAKQTGRSNYAYIENTKAYIENHLNKKFTLEELAENVGLNPSYLSRRFTLEVGFGIQEYTRKKRIEAAKNMLRFSDVPIQRIASYLCFPSQSYFGDVFKKYTGMTPQAYRNWQHTENDPFNTPKEL
ncbi:MAG: AraC family transcriptional regulator [Pseudobutyrivibrio ruminis]|nr:AraC family transcriptional regulator [Pseudobutyrivibrio ruminis]